MLKVGEYDLAPTVARLASFARESGLAGRPARYVLVGRELIPEREMKQSAMLTMRALRLHRQIIQVELPFAAQRIVVNANARAIGLHRLTNATAKVQLRARGQAPSVLRERRARSIVGAYLNGCGLAIPRIRDWDRKHAGWLIEDFVEGEHAGPADMVRFVVNHAYALYLPTARPRRVKRSPAKRQFIEAIEGVLARLAPSLSPIPEDAKWLVGICHNDLTSNNLLCTKRNALWLIDWENAGVAPVVADLGRIYIETPELKAAILNLLQTLDPLGETLSPAHQLAIGAAFAVQKRHLERRHFLHEAIVNQGKSEGDAAREFDGKMAIACASVASLAE